MLQAVGRPQLVVGLFRLGACHDVIAAQPAVQIDIGAALAAERPIAGQLRIGLARTPADRAAALAGSALTGSGRGVVMAHGIGPLFRDASRVQAVQSRSTRSKASRASAGSARTSSTASVSSATASTMPRRGSVNSA